MMERLRNFEYTFRQLLYEEEAIFPKEIFERMHDSAYKMLAMVNWYDSLRRLKQNDPALVEKRAEQYDSMKHAYEKLDEDYRYFDREIRFITAPRRAENSVRKLATTNWFELTSSHVNI